MSPILNIAIKAARKAGDYIIRAGNRLDILTVTEKSKNDFVSEVDSQAERMIIDIIDDNYPAHSILAEESGKKAGNEYQWIIDPLDGTKNFLHGIPHYAVSIGVKINNRLEYGVIYDPAKQELFTAERGRGAQLNNTRIRVNPNYHLHHALIATGFPFKQRQLLAQYRDIFNHLYAEVADMRVSGSAALNLAYVASGRMNGYWEFGVQPWDMAAGILIAREAGGLLSDFDGTENYFQTGNIVAADPKTLKAMLKILQPVYRNVKNDI